MKRNVCRVVAVLVGAALLAAAPASAQSQPAPAAEPPSDVANEYRITGFPSYRINDAWSGFGYLGWVYKPDADYTSYYLGKGFFYSPAKWVHIWGGLIGVYTDSTVKSNSLELRPAHTAGRRRPCLHRQHLPREFQDRALERHQPHAAAGRGCRRLRGSVDPGADVLP